VDLVVAPRRRWLAGAAGIAGLLAAAVPLLTLAASAGTGRCSGVLRRGRLRLVLKGLFLVAGAIVLLASVSYLRRGRYYEGEYYFLIIASSPGGGDGLGARPDHHVHRPELVSGPAFLLAGWRKGDLRSNEAHSSSS